MGYRVRLVGKYFGQLLTPWEWPAYVALAAGRLALTPNNKMHPWARHLLPSTVSLRFSRFRGVPVKLNPSRVTHIQVLEEFLFDNAYDLEMVPFSPVVIVDCGAHIGLFIRLCRGRYSKVPLIAFEPQPENTRFVRDAVSDGTLTLYESAVGTRDGSVEFDSEAVEGYGAVSTGTAGAFRTEPLIDLKRVLRELPAGPLLLKMDVEGAEREILPDIAELLPPRCALFIETHHGLAGWENACRILEGKGFVSRKLRSHGIGYDGFFLRG